MKILFIPEYTGAETSERTPQLLKILKKRHDLVFISQNDLSRRKAFKPLRVFDRIRQTRKLIKEGKKLNGIDLIYCRDYMNAYPGLKIAEHLGKPCVWDSEGSMKAFWDSCHKYPTQVLPWMLLESCMVKHVDYMITVTDIDKKAYIKQGMDPERINIIPICVRSEFMSRKSKGEARRELGLSSDKTIFLFFSNFDYAPNFKALKFLNEEVAPRVEGTVLLSGKGRLPERLHPNVKYLGFLPFEKLYDLIRACDVCLAPIWEANGTLTKVLDMLMHGAPTVVTNVVRKGIPELENGKNALIAESTQDFISKTIQLAGDKELQNKLSNAATDVIKNKYEWSFYEDKLLNLIDSFKECYNPKKKAFLEYEKYSLERGRDIIKLIKPYVSLDNKKILDVGCGSGGVAVAFAKEGADVTAIDIDEEPVEKTKKRSAAENISINVLQKNAEELDFEIGSFDGAILVDFLEYTLKPDAVLERLSKIIKPGGFCYLSVLNKLYWFNKSFKHKKHRQFYFYGALRRMLKKYGFKVKLIKEESINKIENIAAVQTPWRRKIALFLNKVGLKKLMLWWIKSPISPWFDIYWKIIITKVQ